MRFGAVREAVLALLLVSSLATTGGLVARSHVGPNEAVHGFGDGPPPNCWVCTCLGPDDTAHLRQVGAAVRSAHDPDEQVTAAGLSTPVLPTFLLLDPAAVRTVDPLAAVPPDTDLLLVPGARDPPPDSWRHVRTVRTGGRATALYRHRAA